jgi:hypothetical protein
MTKAQERMIKDIRKAVEDAINSHNEKHEDKKEIVRWQVTDEEYFMQVVFTTNYIGERGHFRNEVTGQLFIRERGGLSGQIRTYCNKTEVKSSREFCKIAMWV